MIGPMPHKVGPFSHVCGVYVGFSVRIIRPCSCSIRKASRGTSRNRLPKYHLDLIFYWYLVPGIDFVVPPSPRHLLVPHQQQQQQHPPKNLSVGTLLIAAEDVYTVHCRQPACLDVWWTVVVVVVVVVSSPKCVRRSQNVPISRYSASSEGVYELQYIQPSSKGVPKVTQQQ